MSTQGVGSIKQSAANSKAKRPQELTVKSGENISTIAKKYGMSSKEFMAWTGLKNTNLKAGQKIPLPVATVPEGKGLMALAKAHGMTLDEFCKLNNIPKTYNPAKGEFFYIKTTKPKTETQKAEKAQSKPAAKPKAAKEQSEQPKANLTKPTHAAGNKQNFGSTYTPDELGKQIFQKSCDYYGAVGKPDFDALIDEINPKNVADVIKNYTQNPKNKKKESLINTITSEIRSNKQKRKDAVMKIYDALAKQQGTQPSNREVFVKELNDQFDSWGMVNTDKMDEMIQSMLGTDSKKITNLQSVSSKKVVNVKPNEKIIKGGYITAVGGQLSVASTGAKPPIPLNENGDVIAEVIKFTPSNPKGPLKGKTIMVNAGHGWKKSKVFDQGTSAVDVKGKTIPEWYKNRNFADKLISQLSAQGATVIYTSGAANLVCDAKRNYKADLLISLHCNAAPTNKKKNGLEVFYPEGSAIGERFAKIAEKRLDEHVSFGKQNGPNDHCKTISDKTTRFEKIGLLQVNKESTPSILIEMGYQSNEKDLKNIDWKDFQQKTMGKLVQSVKDYYGIK